MPTLLIYGEGDLRMQLVTLANLNGQKTTERDVEVYLDKLGAITISEERKAHLDDEDDMNGPSRPPKIIR